MNLEYATHRTEAGGRALEEEMLWRQAEYARIRLELIHYSYRRSAIYRLPLIWLTIVGEFGVSQKRPDRELNAIRAQVERSYPAPVSVTLEFFGHISFDLQSLATVLRLCSPRWLSVRLDGATDVFMDRLLKNVSIPILKSFQTNSYHSRPANSPF